MIELVVDSRVRLSAGELLEGVAASLKEEFTHSNPVYYKLKAMNRPTWKESKTIETWDQDGSGSELSFPRGGAGRVLDILQEAGLRARFSDRRVQAPVERLAHSVKLRPYQERSSEEMIGLQNCLLRSGVGSGKTTTALGIIARLGQRALVIVNTVGLLELWLRRLESELGLGKKDVGIIQGKKRQLDRPVVVGMQQSMCKIRGADRRAVRDAFGLLLVDEVHRSAAPTFMGAVDWIPAKYRFGVSDNETRKDGKHFLIYDMFGDAVEVADEELVGYYTVEVELRLAPTRAKVGWYRQIASHNPFDDEVQSKPKELPDFGKLVDELSVDPARNEQVVDIVCEEHAGGHSVLVFTNRREHCRLIRALLKERGVEAGLLLGGKQYQKEFEETVRRLCTRELRAAVGTVQAMGTGIDMPPVDRGVLATPMPSNKQLFRQVKGRICRMAEGKTDAVLYYLFDDQAFGRSDAAKLMRWSARTSLWEGAGKAPGGEEAVARYLEGII